MTALKYLPSYTVADYQNWEGDWELWRGIPVSMSPLPFGRHQRTLSRLSQRFWNALDKIDCTDCEVLIECDWIVQNDTVVRPDLSIVCGVTTERHIQVPPALIVEILSASTQMKDRTAKRELYSIHGVRYYILLDPDSGQTEINRLNAVGAYEPISITQQETFELHPGCQLPIQTILGTSF